MSEFLFTSSTECGWSGKISRYAGGGGGKRSPRLCTLPKKIGLKVYIDRKKEINLPHEVTLKNYNIFTHSDDKFGQLTSKQVSSRVMTIS